MANTQNATLRSGSATKHEKHRKKYGDYDKQKFFVLPCILCILWALFFHETFDIALFF